MNNSKNKKRVANFTDSECSLLLRVVNNFNNIIENKKTDAVTWKQKEATWKKVVEKFNAESPGPRCSEIQLKYKYMAIKKHIKKQFSTHTSYVRGTGGGAYVPPPIPKNEEEKVLMETIALSVKGLQNDFDSDALAECSGVSAAQLNAMDYSENTETDVVETDWNQPHATLLQTPKHPVLNINLGDFSQNEKNFPETQVDIPKSPLESLTNPPKNLPDDALPKINTWQSRRRPVIPKKKTVSSAAGKFENLAEKKCQLIEIEQNIARQKENQCKIEQEIHIKLLQGQHEQNNLKLELLVGQNEEQRLKIKLLEGQNEEQKLKIELLKVQLNNANSVKKIQIAPFTK